MAFGHLDCACLAMLHEVRVLTCFRRLLETQPFIEASCILLGWEQCLIPVHVQLHHLCSESLRTGSQQPPAYPFERRLALPNVQLIDENQDLLAIESFKRRRSECKTNHLLIDECDFGVDVFSLKVSFERLFPLCGAAGLTQPPPAAVSCRP